MVSTSLSNDRVIRHYFFLTVPFVDVEFHQLVRTWLVCASCQMPVISKSFELQIQVGGGKGSNKVK